MLFIPEQGFIRNIVDILMIYVHCSVQYIVYTKNSIPILILQQLSHGRLCEGIILRKKRQEY